MPKDPPRSITQLDFERRWLLARIDHEGLGEAAAQDLMRRIEDLDLATAASSSESLAELTLKAERFAAAYWPSGDPAPQDCIEHILLNAILRDLRELSEQA